MAAAQLSVLPSLPTRIPLLTPRPIAFPPSLPSLLPFTPGSLSEPSQLGWCLLALVLVVALKLAFAHPTTMEVHPQKSTPDSTLSPVRVLGGVQRPHHLSGFGSEPDGFLGSPKSAVSSSPVTTLTRTMHDLAGLGR